MTSSTANRKYDALVVGSGPNGLAAAIRLAQKGLSVKLFEAKETIGGGTRTLELTEPGFRHDICSAIHPMAVSSPYLATLPLQNHGLEWIHPDVPLAHPMENRPAVIQYHDLDRTAEELGLDRQAYSDLMSPLARHWAELTPDILAPFGFPKHPLRMAQFGLKAIQPAQRFGMKRFSGIEGRALFAGLAAHSIQSFEKPVTTAIGLVLGAAAHTVGWPMPRRGSQSIADALAGYFRELGGEIETGMTVESLNQLPNADAILFDLTPRQVDQIAGNRFPARYRKKLMQYRYGAGVFKIDYILNEPVPWSDSRCNLAGTVHVGGTFEEIAHSESLVSRGEHPDKPYVLVAQQSLFDESRTPDSRHTLWAYCHVPSGSDLDMTTAIENQIERFAPGFRDVVAARRTMTSADFEEYNPNYIGGDINGGLQDIRQLFARPVSLLNPYTTPAKGIYFCSSSTPPGGGVHGMCGYHAAQSVLKREFGIR
ncbi:MAG: NAD(P)/FAD-dependent oxidoreductase [Balneolaceae bacterium]